MTGPSEGVIGMESAGVLQRFTNAFGERFAVQRTGTRQFCAMLATVDTGTGHALEVKRIQLRGLA
jgi:calcineurin-like phosphoesterase